MSDRIDELAKSISTTGVSRRGAFRRLIGGIFGLGAAAVLPKKLSAQGEPDLTAQCIQAYCKDLRGLERLYCNFFCVVQGGHHQNNNYPF